MANTLIRLTVGLVAPLAFAGCLNLGSGNGVDDGTQSPTSQLPGGQAAGGGNASIGTGIQPVTPGQPGAVGNGGTGNTNQPVSVVPNPVPVPPGQDANQPAVEAIVPVTGMARYSWVGRFDLSNPSSIAFTFLSSKMGVRFTGTSISMDLASTNKDGFNVLLDGKQMPPLMLSPSGATRYVVASNLAPGTHTLWLSKRTEFNQNGTNTITLSNMALDTDATFMTPPKPLTRRIEAIGDSGLAGYGVEGLYIYGDPAHPQCAYETTNQNGDLSVPAQVAKALDAEIVNLSWSGKGVVASQYDNNASHMLPVVYDELVGNDTTRLYDFKSQKMDVVIIGAGANDFIGTAGAGAMKDANKFIQVYADWLVRIRGHYPQALIVAAVGANAKQNDRTLMIQYLTAAVAEAQAKLGGSDPNIIFFDYFAGDANGWTTYGDVAEKGKYAWGCNYHPSIAGSTWLADRMVPVIRAKLGW